MKKKIFLLLIFLLLIFLLCFPSEALAASQEGLRLWLDTLLPTLLPFLILTGILIRTDRITKILHPIAPFFKVVFGLSPGGTYVFILGMLTGYPMGAKLAADLYYAGKISRQEAEYLLTFCNNPSPAFLITYVGRICLEGKIHTRTLIGILLLADMLCMAFFRFAVFRRKEHKEFYSPNLLAVENTDTGLLLDTVIMSSFETMTKLGGYILLFSVLSAAVGHFWFLPATGKYIFLSALEITTGLHSLQTADISYSFRVFLAFCMSAFGGFCIMAQTKSVLGKELSFHQYASAKCMNAAITAILTLIFLL